MLEPTKLCTQRAFATTTDSELSASFGGCATGHCQYGQRHVIISALRAQVDNDPVHRAQRRSSGVTSSACPTNSNDLSISRPVPMRASMEAEGRAGDQRPQPGVPGAWRADGDR